MSIMLTTNFSEKEFECKCGCGIGKMSREFMAKLQLFRDIWKRPMVVTSGLRCLRYNIAVKGKANSRHLIGIAADIAVMDSEVYEFVKLAIELGFKGIGVGSGFVHLDGRGGDGVMWCY